MNTAEIEATETNATPMTAAIALLAWVGVAGSLWLSLGSGLKACPLCLYQRIFAMSAAAALTVGLMTSLRHSAQLLLTATPMAAAGLAIAAFHVRLETTGVLECPRGLGGVGSAPEQSAAYFALLFAALSIGALVGRAGFGRIIAATVLGVVLAGAAIQSAPPLPPAPTQPYETPLDGCRPAYVP